MTVQVEAWELEYHDAYANSHKFYRLYVLPNVFVAQWGGVGKVGQFKLTTPAGRWEAEKQSDSKIKKGYEISVPPLTFDIDDQVAHNVKAGYDFGVLNHIFVTGANGQKSAAAAALVQQRQAATQAKTEAFRKKEADLKDELLAIAGRLLPENEGQTEPPTNQEQITVEVGPMATMLDTAMKKAQANGKAKTIAEEFADIPDDIAATSPEARAVREEARKAIHTDVAHITNGRDHDGTEWTLCGLKATWTAEDTRRAAAAGRWCQKCRDLDG